MIASGIHQRAFPPRTLSPLTGAFLCVRINQEPRYEMHDSDFSTVVAWVGGVVLSTLGWLISREIKRNDEYGQRIDKLEQRPAPPVASVSPAPLPTFAQPAPMIPAPAPALAPQSVAPVAPPLPPLAIPSETTQVAPTPPRGARASRIPVNGYVLREVRDGVAVLEGHAGLRQVTMGDAIPGAGTVRAIQKRGSEWVVVTSIGVIDGKAY